MLRTRSWMILGAVPMLASGCGLANAAALLGPSKAGLGPVQHATRVVGTDPRIAVSGGSVNVALTSAAGNTLSLTYQLPKHSRVSIVHHGSWLIRVILPQHIDNAANAYLHVRVPTTASLSGSTAGGDLSAHGVYRRVWLDANGGDLDGTHLTTGSLVAETQGGDLSVSWSKPPAAVTLESAGGDIYVTGPWSPASLISSAGGDIHVTGHPTVRTVVHLTAVGGDISSGFSSLASALGVSGQINAIIGPSSTVTLGKLVVHAAGGDISVDP